MKKLKLDKALLVAAGLNALIAKAQEQDFDAMTLMDGIVCKVDEHGRVYYDCGANRSPAAEAKIVSGFKWLAPVHFEAAVATDASVEKNGVSPLQQPVIGAVRPYVIDDIDIEGFYARLAEEGIALEPQDIVTGKKILERSEKKAAGVPGGLKF